MLYVIGDELFVPDRRDERPRISGFSQRRERRDEQMRPECVTLSLPKAAKRLRNTERTENSHTVLRTQPAKP